MEKRPRTREPKHREATSDTARGVGRDPSPPILLPLHEAAAAPRTLIGGKAATLARLQAAGFPVPDGVVVTARAAGDGGSAGHPSEVAEAGAPSLPSEVEAALVEALRALDDPVVAVRSSGVAEDLGDASYAGQYASYLDVQGIDAVAEAVRACWASAHAERVVTYHARQGHHGAAPMAVLVQRMVPADAAGVAFTADPVTGERDCVVINAVRGTGERLVAGHVTPDSWTVRDGDAQGGRSDEAALDEAQARAVAELARRVEAELGEPQDIEWALADGRVHLLQARPITRLPTPPEIEPPPGPWMKDTVHYKGPISPLAATAYLPRLEQGGRRLCEAGILMEGVRQRALGWEVYAQPTPPSSDDLVRERIDAAIDLVRNDRASELVQRWRDAWRPEFERRIETLRGRDLAALDDEALDAQLQACLGLLDDGQQVHFALFPPYVLAAYDLATTCEALLEWGLTSALDLVTGLSEASAAPTLALAEMADAVRADPDARRTVREWRTDTPAAQRIEALQAAAPELAQQLDELLGRYGCAVPAYDVGDPTNGERPEPRLRLLRDLVTAERDPLRTREELARRRQETADRARATMAARGATEAQRRRFEEVLARAQERWGLREENLLYTDAMPNGLIRLTALEVGRRLAERGRLRRAEDAVWLELDELRAALRGEHVPGEENLSQRVERRRREHAWVRAHPGPPLYGDPPPPPPPKHELPEEARYLNTAFDWLMGLEYGPPAAAGNGNELGGLAGSPGRTTGTARVVHDPEALHRVTPGDVLVCRLTTPAWTVAFSRVSAVVTDAGSPLSHAAIVAREHGIPAVVGTQRATQEIDDGATVTVDGAAGSVAWTAS